MAIQLSDDGTMDTVLVCSECGRELRYNYSGDGDETYEDFVAWALEDAAIAHQCEMDDDEG